MFLNKITKFKIPKLFQNHIFKKIYHRSVPQFVWKHQFVNDQTQLKNKYLYGQNSDNSLLYNSSLNIDSKANSLRHSGIICTIGPASSDVKIIENLINAGMNIARLNFSHGSHEYHLKTIDNIRKAVKSYNRKTYMDYPLAIALDTKGPEIRTGLIDGKNGATKDVKLNKGDTLRLSTDKQFENKGSNKVVYVDYENITKILKKNSKIYVDDGLILLTAMQIGENYIDCKVENEGILGSRKGINLPGVAVDLPPISEKDRADIKFAADNDLDMIFASFVRDSSTIDEIRKILDERQKRLLIVSKIENHQGIHNLASIIEASDGIMVARGDLGIEIPPEKVFLAQKSILAQCNLAGKPGICATQMLESMTNKPRATRAESSDVANAILDGADCVMLSGETAKGEFPIESVQTMDKLCREAESVIKKNQFFRDMAACLKTNSKLSWVFYTWRAMTIVNLAELINAKAIIVSDRYCGLAHAIAMFRPQCIILAVTDNRMVARQCHLYRGIIPLIMDEGSGVCELDFSKECLEQRQYGIDVGRFIKILCHEDIIVAVSQYSISLAVVD